MFLNKPLVESPSHKTVVVLDHGPKFAHLAGSNVSPNVKDEQGVPIIGILEKTMWNCSVEAVLEYHRVLNDLFPNGTKQIRVVVSDFVGRFLTPPWSNKLISHEELLKSLATCDVPQASGDASLCSIMNGISMAIEVISERTNLQKIASDICYENSCQNRFVQRKNYRRRVLIPRDPQGRNLSFSTTWPKIHLSSNDTRTKNNDIQLKSNEIAGQTSIEHKNKAENEIGRINYRLRNSGTIIVFTSIDKISDFDAIVDNVFEEFNARNDSITALNDPSFLVIHRLDLIVINVLDRRKETNIGQFCLTSQKSRSVLKSTLVSACGGKPLLATMHKTLQDIYDLVSTTVSGIPMKEEAQQGQSVNYDVELLHHRKAHLELEQHGVLRLGSKIIAKSETGIYETICLKWCTSGPKMKSDKFPLLQNSCLITPTNVNSRPTVCLTSFVLAGKCVMLEVSRDLLHASNFNMDSSLPQSSLESNLHQKLISHFLCRDEITGALVIQSVAMGKKATLNDYLIQPSNKAEIKSEFKKSNLNYALMVQLMNSAALTIDPMPKLALIDPETKFQSFPNGGPMLTWQERREKILEPLKMSIHNLTRYFPASLHDSFIFHFVEKFEPIFSILQKHAITVKQFEECKKFIFALVTSRNSSEPLTLKRFDCVYTEGGKTLTKNEQFRIAFDELAKVMNNFVHFSQMHRDLLNIFVETSGITFVSPLLSNASVQPAKGGMKRPLADETLSDILLPKKDSQPIPKRFKKKFGSVWTPGESVNLLDYFTSLYDNNRWIKWKDFVGREKAGDQAQNALYPNLKLNEATTVTPLNKNGKISGETKAGSDLPQQKGHAGGHYPSHHAAHQRGSGTADHHFQRRHLLNQMHSRGRGARHGGSGRNGRSRSGGAE